MDTAIITFRKKMNARQIAKITALLEFLFPDFLSNSFVANPTLGKSIDSIQLIPFCNKGPNNPDIMKINPIKADVRRSM